MVQYARLSQGGTPMAPPSMGTAKPTSAGGKPPPRPEYHFQMAFFVAACSAVACSLIGQLLFVIIPFAPIFEFLDYMNEVYLMVFGLILFILDAPLNFRWILEARLLISRYCRFLTRMAGKGIYLMFLGCLTFTAMYIEEIAQNLAIILAAYIFGLGLITFLVGVSKSNKLNKIRLALQQRCGEDYCDMSFVNQYCRSLPDTAITQQEFVQMSAALIPGFVWGEAEIKHVTAALSCEQGPSDTMNWDIVTLEDMRDWIQPGWGVMM